MDPSVANAMRGGQVRLPMRERVTCMLSRICKTDGIALAVLPPVREGPRAISLQFKSELVQVAL